MKKLLLLACCWLPAGRRRHPARYQGGRCRKPAPRAASRPVRPWYRPAHLLLQTGGGLGKVAAGAGLRIFENPPRNRRAAGLRAQVLCRLRAQPGFAQGHVLAVRLQVAHKVQVLPLTVGAYVSYTHGIINDGVQGQYPSDYYWFSVDTRWAPCWAAGSRTWRRRWRPRGSPANLGLLRVGHQRSVPRQLLRKPNGGLGFGKILTLALGVKADFYGRKCFGHW